MSHPDGVDMAYDFVEPSYQWAIERFDAVDAKLQNFLSFAASVTLAVPVVAKSANQSLSLTSGWFWGAVSTFLLLVVLYAIATVPKRISSLKLIDPTILWDKWLDDSREQFKRDMLFFAGEHFDTNHWRIEMKGRLLTAMNVLFLVESALWVIWVS